MELKVGRKYVNGEGEIIEIVSHNADYMICGKPFPFWGDNDKSYRADGSFWLMCPSKKDLIKEIDCPIASKYNEDKPDLSLLTQSLQYGISRGLMFGSNKYARDDWRTRKELKEHFAAMMRHATRWNDGYDLDDESRLSNLYHVGCRLMFLIELIEDGTGIDYRYRKVKKL